MGILAFIQYIILSICFILIPAWFLIFVVSYFLELKKVLNNSILLPLSLFCAQLGLYHFYFQGNRLYELDLLFILLSLLNICIILFLAIKKIENKTNLYLIPFIIEIVWIISYLYLKG